MKCDGKIAYASSGAAAQALRCQTRRDRQRGRNKPYHCDDCGQWHLGNPSAMVPRQLRELRRRRIKLGREV